MIKTYSSSSLDRTPLTRKSIAQFLVVSMHVAGIIGLAIPYTQPIFLILTPFNLLCTLFLLIDWHIKWTKKFAAYIAIAWIVSFTVEALGVNTGQIFGAYTYGPVLGPQLFDTPLMIGVNWLILLISTGHIAALWHQNPNIRALIAASLMVAMDLIIEPVAIYFNFWNWQQVDVPLQNYLGWFITALILQLLYSHLKINPKNRLAILVILSQTVFFIALNLIIFKQA
ncbi:MAG: carotenoid biosynthesis protein [Cyclobacteriaceae bacterium]